MHHFLKQFLIIISLYFILHTAIVFGLFDGQYKEIVSSSKELIWLGFVGVMIIRNRKTAISYIKQSKWQLFILGLMACIGLIVTYTQTASLQQFAKNSIIWLKYGRYFMFIFWSAGLVGKILSFQLPVTSYQLQDINSKEETGNWKLETGNLANRIKFIVRLSWFILLGGLVIQGSKILFPDLWYMLGFGGLDIYRVGVAPPLYYLTKHDGVMRFSGLFSGPNNFAFWLIAFTPLLRQDARQTTHKAYSILKQCGIVLFGILNLGRVIIVGWLSELVPTLAKNGWIRNNRFIVRLGTWAIICLFAFITYSKRESTTEHFALWLQALEKFFANPRGYGLGSSGPGVHRNGSLLPENYYLQLALDYGFLWPLCFAWFWWLVFKSYKLQVTSYEPLATDTKLETWSLKHEAWNCFVTGFIGMLIAWCFLHVFEDSMVNYLFFVSWWVTYGMLQVPSPSNEPGTGNRKLVTNL
jgi:hypothetical protein